jgi:hypothetical protein
MHPKFSPHNIPKLPTEAIAIIGCLLSGEIEGYENVYMVEVKLDYPLNHIKNGTDGFIIHTNVNQELNAAKHLWSHEWAVVHKEYRHLKNANINVLKQKVKEYLDKLAKEKEITA